MTPNPPALMGKRVRIWLLLLFLSIASVAFLLYLVDHQQIQLPANDFTMYWSSAKLLLSGANPYDPAGLSYFQKQETNRDTDAVLMYYPPWSMLWIAPLGLLKHDISQVVWLLLNTAVVFLCAHQIWLYIGGQTRYHWVTWVIAFTFGPTFAALGYTGQITPLLLLGFTYFYININRPGKDWLGGISLVLIGIKPQVYYLFFGLFFFWALHQRRWKLLISTAITLGVATLFSKVFDHQIISHFFQNLSKNTPIAWATPTIGTYLRYYLGMESFTIQFIPALLAGLVAFYYWWVRRSKWSWQDSLPGILFLSAITSPYTWTYDFVPLIIPLLVGFSSILSRVSRLAAIIMTGSYGLINGVYWWLHFKYSDFYFLWFAPALFIWFIMIWKLSFQNKVGMLCGSIRTT